MSLLATVLEKGFENVSDESLRAISGKTLAEVTDMTLLQANPISIVNRVLVNAEIARRTGTIT